MAGVAGRDEYEIIEHLKKALVVDDVRSQLEEWELDYDDPLGAFTESKIRKRIVAARIKGLTRNPKYKKVPAAKIAREWGCDPRTAKRILALESPMNGPQFVALCRLLARHVRHADGSDATPTDVMRNITGSVSTLERAKLCLEKLDRKNLERAYAYISDLEKQQHAGLDITYWETDDEPDAEREHDGICVDDGTISVESELVEP